MENKKNILLLGPPGAGKGTQAKFIEKEFGKTKIDAGNLIRESIKHQSPLGLKAQKYVNAGKLIPDQMVLEIIIENLKDLVKSEKSFLLDGFPRNISQARSLEEILKKNNLSLDLVFELKVDFEKLTQRIINRRICQNKSCGAVYHLIFSPPKVLNTCDFCGSSLYQRSDDKEDLLKARIETYCKETLPLSDFYQEQNKLFEINGNSSSKEVSETIRQLINQANKTK